MILIFPMGLPSRDQSLERQAPRGLDEVMRRLGRKIARADELHASEHEKPPLRLGFEAFDRALPDGGIPRGSVVEITSYLGLARATGVALGLCASVQREAFDLGGRSAEGGWCGWLDPSQTLHAGGVQRAGASLRRLLVMRPEPRDLSRVAVRAAASRVFSLLVIDTVCDGKGWLWGTSKLTGNKPHASRSSLSAWSNVVRRLALAIEGTDTTVVLLTERSDSERALLPVALRLGLERPVDQEARALGANLATSAHCAGRLRVLKERFGRVSPQPLSFDLPAPHLEQSRLSTFERAPAGWR